MENEQLAARIKEIIVETLALEDVDPTTIETDAPLFGEGLGLDSIDALELALAFHKEFGVRTQENDENNREYYSSVGSLVKFITDKQAEAASSEA
ncbi:MAG: phosphopantetheine-binding protein [Planctomycetota bacterium]|nr:phosphopantetheine-binding protein [Planctomycetota bacterium]